MLHCITLYYIIVRYTILYYTMLYYNTPLLKNLSSGHLWAPLAHLGGSGTSELLWVLLGLLQTCLPCLSKTIEKTKKKQKNQSMGCKPIAKPSRKQKKTKKKPKISASVGFQAQGLILRSCWDLKFF